MSVCGVCQGKGWIWRDRFKELMCWQCLGKGAIGDRTDGDERPTPKES